MLNVARARFELDSAEETPSQIREPQRSLRLLPRGEDGQTVDLTLRHTAESVRGPFRPLRSEVTVRRRIAVLLVLPARILDPLARKRVLQVHRGHWNAVQAQRDIHRLPGGARSVARSEE